MMKRSSRVLAACTLLVLNYASTVHGACSGGAPNGITQAPEVCDDGNLLNSDACLNDCTFAFCGDGFVRGGVEDCDGTACCTVACTLAASSTECRAVAGPCDIAENCTGSTPTCPANQFQGNTFECRPAAAFCDSAEFCTGTAATCPTNAFKPTGTLCDDNDVCTDLDTCNGTGLCVGTCDDGNTCTRDSCPDLAGCTHDGAANNGLSCDDSNPCTQPDTCTNGECGGPPDSSMADTDEDGYCDYQENIAGCNALDPQEIPAQPASFGGAPRGIADFVVTYAAPAQRRVSPATDPSCGAQTPGGAVDTGRCGRFGTCPTANPPAGEVKQCVENQNFPFQFTSCCGIGDCSCSSNTDCAANGNTGVCSSSGTCDCPCTSNADCVYGPTGFCSKGRIADPCVSNADCNLAVNTCRVVLNYADVSGVALSSVTINRQPDPVAGSSFGFAPVTRGCARKVDVQLDGERTTNQLRIEAAATVDGVPRVDRDRFIYR